MKFQLLFALLLSGLPARAYYCPQDMSGPRTELQRWLAPLNGIHDLPNCRVELTICVPDPEKFEGPMIAEVYVIDRHGREAYLSLTLAESEKFNADAKIYPRRLHFIKRDKYYESEFGRTETSRLDIRLDENGALRSLDLGTYATNKALRRPDGSKSRWYNCGLGAE